jgi:hypothetical protein
MASQDFFRRWSRLKRENDAHAVSTRQPPATRQTSADAVGGRQPGNQPDDRLPTLADVARLTAESDYSKFVAPGVDRTVRRMALKKLFSDPHFNIMDGLDIYIDDYTKADPVSEAMLASLKHAQSVFGRSTESCADKLGEGGLPQDEGGSGRHARHDPASEPFLPSNAAANRSLATDLRERDAMPSPDQSSPKGTA